MTVPYQLSSCIEWQFADAGEEAGVTLLLEPLNTQLFATMYLTSTKLGLDLIEAVDSPNLRLLYDVRHSAVIGEDIAEVLAGRIHLVAHVQVCVHGIRGLRVVDCSVMPSPPSGNTNGPAMGIAWRAAELIQQDSLPS